MVKKMELIRMLNSPDNKRALQAVEELRVRGWLRDGSLVGVPLCHVHIQGGDLLGANLSNVDFHQARLQNADLSQANLSGAKLTRANLQGANLSQADLSGADLFKADLTEACNLQDEQLKRALRLWGALMPDGETYDGRFNLPGDLDFARWGRVDIYDPLAMAEFFGVSLETYLYGQELGKQISVIEASL